MSSASKMAASIEGRHLQLNEQLWLSEKVFQNVCLHRGLPFAIKRTILIGCTGAHFRGAFCLLSLHSEVGDVLEAPLRQTLNANWAENHRGGAFELTRRRPWTQLWCDIYSSDIHCSLEWHLMWPSLCTLVTFRGVTFTTHLANIWGSDIWCDSHFTL